MYIFGSLIESNVYFCSFIKKTVEIDYVAILHNASLEGSDGCWSRLGKRGGRQPLSLGGNCANNVGVPIHEFMHALGNKTLCQFYKNNKIIKYLILWLPL